jgi:uncharacterized protein YjbJ (UPF0337 family)
MLPYTLVLCFPAFAREASAFLLPGDVSKHPLDCGVQACERRYSMNWDQIEGQWKQMRGKFKTKWGKLTDSDFDQIAGKREQFLGKLQERYGYTREQAERELNTFDPNADVKKVA